MYVIKYNEEYKTRRFLIDLNPVDLIYYSHLITLDKYNERMTEFALQTK